MLNDSNISRDDIFSHEHILLCGDNFNSLSIVRSLGEYGIRPTVVIVQEGHIPLVEKSKYIGRVIKTQSIESGVETVVQLASSLSTKPFIYTNDDNHASEIDKQYDALKDIAFFFNAGESGRITHLMNKKVLCDLAQECGFLTPRGEIVNRGTLPTTLSYPVYTKTLTPYSQGWKRDADIFFSPDELLEGYKNMISEKFLIQEYINKKNEFEIHGFSINGGKDVYLSYYSLYYRLGKTTFGSYKYYQMLTDHSLEQKIKDMVRMANYSGVFEAEFIVDNNTELRFLEINFRFPLSNYACTFGGVNLPVLWAQSVLSGEIHRENIHPTKKFFSFMNEVPDFMQSVRRKKVSFHQWFRELKTADCLLLFNRDDIYPFISYIVHSLFALPKKKIKKLFHILKLI